MPTCAVIIQNQLPAEWGIHIIAEGIKFFYKNPDGSINHDWQTVQGTDIAGGQSIEIDSNEPASCVGSMIAALTVRAPGKPDQIFTKNDGSDAGHCTTRYEVSLHPAADENVKTLEEALSSKTFTLSVSRNTEKMHL